MPSLVFVIISIALLFDFLNGFHDSANSIATVVATRVLTPRQAVAMAAIANFISAFVFTTAVAATIGKGIISPTAITSETILAGLIGACVWNVITWYLGLPTSSSHALIGSLIGATVVGSGIPALIWGGIIKIVAFIAVAPVLGAFGAIGFTVLVLSIIQNRTASVLKVFFNRMQIASSFLYSLGHGTNDAQKTMGIISLTLFSNQLLGETFYVPTWVILSSHAAIAIGTYFGGWRIVKTMGTKLIHLRPFEGFCAETSSALVLFGTALVGIPVSTTHVIAGSIVGVGTAENAKQVRWITTRKIVAAWLLTIPVALVFGAGFRLLINLF